MSTTAKGSANLIFLLLWRVSLSAQPHKLCTFPIVERCFLILSTISERPFSSFVNSTRFFHDDFLSCEDVESLANFCSGYRKIGQLCFVVDQINDLVPEPRDKTRYQMRKRHCFAVLCPRSIFRSRSLRRIKRPFDIWQQETLASERFHYDPGEGVVLFHDGDDTDTQLSASTK